jgi:hypothetical protein
MQNDLGVVNFNAKGSWSFQQMSFSCAEN